MEKERPETRRSDRKRGKKDKEWASSEFAEEEAWKDELCGVCVLLGCLRSRPRRCEKVKKRGGSFEGFTKKDWMIYVIGSTIVKVSNRRVGGYLCLSLALSFFTIEFNYLRRDGKMR